MTQDEIQSELLARLRKLGDLNPDISIQDRERLVWLADNAGAEFFPVAAELVSELARACRDCAVRRDGRAILQEYHDYLDEGADRLAAQGEIAAPQVEERGAGAFTQALVPRVQSDALDYCKVLSCAKVPRDLEKAVTAFLRRNQILTSVLEFGVRVLWHLDRRAALSWISEYFRENDGKLDPENVRDMLTVILEDSIIAYPDGLLDWIVRFSGDEDLLEYWPRVIRLSDKVVCRQGLKYLFSGKKPGNTLLRQLAGYAERGEWNDDRLLQWTRSALAELGNSVVRFIMLEKGEFSEEWRGMSLYMELNRIASLFLPMLLCADTILSLPDGTEQFALAFLGLSGNGGKDWERSLQHFAHEAVRRSFVLDMKAHRTPVKTIERLCFGDSAALRSAMSALDLGSQQFENMEQREKVIKLLAVYYASYRRSKFLMMEVSRRYHRLMRMIHEDFLSTRMDAEKYHEITSREILPEISTIAAESRKFLSKRQVMDNSLEELLAARISFDRFVRQKRLSFFRKLRFASEE